MMGTASVFTSEKKDALGCHWESDECSLIGKVGARKNFRKIWEMGVRSSAIEVKATSTSFC
jgi:hypothetical protein